MKSTVYRRGPDGSMVAAPDDSTPRREPRPGVQRDHPAPKPERVQRRAPREPQPATQRELQQSVKRRARIFARSPFARLLTRLTRMIGLAAFVYIGLFAYLAFSTSGSLHKVDAAAATPLADTRGTNWLLVGSDSRDGLTPAEQLALHTGKALGNQRADAIILVHMDGLGNPTVISIPRDSFLTIPAHVASDGEKVGSRKNKVNAAYAFGGASLLTATVEANTGMHIDHFMEIGFAGIRDITDAIGGVEVCVPRNYVDRNSGLNVKKGCQTFNGKTALAYVRMRYADPTGDLGRVQRQQQYLAAVVHRVAQPANFLNPLRMRGFAKAGTAALTVGQDTGLVDLAKLAWAMRDLSHGNGKLLTVPISNPDATTSAGSSVLWDKGAAHEVFVNLGAQ